MQATSILAGEPTLSDADYVDLVQQALTQRAPAALKAIFANATEHPALWSSETGQMLLIEFLGLLVEAIADGDTMLAVDTLKACPPAIAEKGHSLLLLAFFPDGHVGDLVALDDAALLCLAMLTHRIGHRTRACELLDQATARRLPSTMESAASAIRDHFAQTASTRFKAKLIIWGLDDTLWHGRLADGGDLVLHEQRAGFIRAFNAHGIVSAICAQTDAGAAKAQLEALGLWDQFVFPRIGLPPTGEVVSQLIEDMLLQPANVLFIDIDPRTLDDVTAAVPGIRVMNAASNDCDAMLQRLLDENSHVTSNRVADYRILEARVRDRQSLSDADFLMQSDMQATYTHRMDNLVFVERIEELINRADPLNYTETRVVPGMLREIVMNVSDYDVFCAFIWDKYGHHGLDGLVGTVVYHRSSRRPLHLAFSCRIMHMGVEDFLMKKLVERYGDIDLSQLAKPLPAQSSAAIAYVPFEEVREQILATQAPRDRSKIRLRVMSDCMSGAFHHYSRFKSEIDFDNIPRVFKLASMVTGQLDDRALPEFLVYNAAIDYMDWRWDGVMARIDPVIYAQALNTFCELVVTSERKLLLFLPPENAPDSFHAVLPHLTGAELKARDRAFNALWREVAGRFPQHIEIIGLDSFVTPAEMLGHAYHYAPSVLMRLTEMMDDWFMRQCDAPSPEVGFA